MPSRAPLTALLVGSVSRDLQAAGSAPGGVVHHAGSALTRLGLRTRVVTRVRPEDADELLGPLRRLGAEVCAHASAQTTTYRNDYGGRVDRHQLLASSDPIGPEQVPQAWRRADLVQLGPLHPTDLRPGLAAHLSGWTGVDVQGWLRSRPGEVPAAPRLDLWLAAVDVVQSSEADLAQLVPDGRVRDLLAHGRARELIVTRGARGARIFERGGEIADVAAVPVAPRDLVGAGDVFLASYLLGRVRGHPPVEAARLAARVSAAKIEGADLRIAEGGR